MPTPSVFALRLQPEVKTKVDYLSKRNNRSINKEIEYIVMQHIEAYEKEHGLIPVPAAKERA